MGYDFRRSYRQAFTNSVSTELVNTRLRTLHGFFGPKFQTGSTVAGHGHRYREGREFRGKQ